MKSLEQTALPSLLSNDLIEVLDIGARWGVHSRWNPLAKFIKVTAFEPDSEECSRINAAASQLPYKLQCLPFALGDENRSGIPLYICKDPGCSSLFLPNRALVDQFDFGNRMEVTRSLSVSVRTLADICDEYQLKPDVIKIDTQGFELNILKGTDRHLPQVKFLELEVEFNEQYQNQPLFSDVDLYMRSKGFALLGLRRTYWRRKVGGDVSKSPFGGQLIHGDAIYYNEKMLQSEETSSQDLLKLCMILSAYRQDDFIAYLLTTPHPSLSSIAESSRKEMYASLKQSQVGVKKFFSKLLDLVRKRLWLPHAKLRELLDSVQSVHSEDWHDPDFF